MSWSNRRTLQIAAHSLEQLRSSIAPECKGYIPGLLRMIAGAGLTLAECGTSEAEMQQLEHRQRLLACKGALRSLRDGRPDYWTPKQLFDLLRQELGSGDISLRKLKLSEREYAELASRYGG